MSRTPSNMLPLGTPAADFSLPDVVTGRQVSPADFSHCDALLVMFICRHCPYVTHVEGELARLGRDYASRRLGMVAISANDAEEYPEDAPAGLRAMSLRLGFGFPYLYDESQAVARVYQAACTPGFFLFDCERKLVYRGQLDDSRPHNGRLVTGADLRAAIDAVLAGSPVSADQHPSLGCNIKWKPGATASPHTI